MSQTTVIPGIISDDIRPAIAGNESRASGVSWAAILAGAAVSAGLSLLLLLLGSGFGLASISPWPNSGASAAAFGIGAAIWLVVVQWLSSGVGGYLAGRLRTKWVGVHTDEVFFRDTAHGLVSWAVSTVLVVGLVVISAAAIVKTGVEAVGSVAGAAAEGVASATDPMAYFTDTLFRSTNATTNDDARAEALRIVARGVTEDTFPDDDRTYLTQLVATQTGLAQPDAEQRVDAVIANAQAAEADVRQAADDATDAAARLAFFTFLSMLVGAFIACVAAAIGGRQRDEHEAVVR